VGGQLAAAKGGAGRRQLADAGEEDRIQLADTGQEGGMKLAEVGEPKGGEGSHGLVDSCSIPD